tara:strand:- start:3352 stop:3789 length:438 start_codon:yes stop_codon:yes gene_type:complete
MLKSAFFKSCPILGHNVDITDVRWPSLREAARRFLREDGCILSVPQEYEKRAWNLVQKISDHVPSKLDLPDIVIGELCVVGLAQIGGVSPSLDICWVPNSNFSDFEEQVLDLLDAGYPGCIGCGGPGSEGEWNEPLRRAEIEAEI